VPHPLSYIIYYSIYAICAVGLQLTQSAAQDVLDAANGASKNPRLMQAAARAGAVPYSCHRQRHFRLLPRWLLHSFNPVNVSPLSPPHLSLTIFPRFDLDPDLIFGPWELLASPSIHFTQCGTPLSDSCDSSCVHYWSSEIRLLRHSAYCATILPACIILVDLERLAVCL
jgi:hypothetical protein